MKVKIIGVLIFMVTVLVSCGTSKVSIRVDDVNCDTIGINKDGSIILAELGEFDKEYYDMDDFQSFANEAVSSYNSTVGNEAVKITNVKKKDSNVYITMQFENMEHFADFHMEDGRLVTVSEAWQEGLLTGPMIHAKTGTQADQQEVLKEGNNKTVIVNGKYTVTVKGKVMYYSNGILINNATVQTQNEKEPTIIIYK